MATITRQIRIIERVVIPLSFLVLVILYIPIITAHQLVGWDLTPHYYIVHKTTELLIHGKISGYDVGWFAGYPLFKLYGVGPYIGALLAWILSGGVVSVVSSFHIFLGCIPLVLFYSIYKFSRLLFGRISAIFSIPLFFSYFLAPVDYFSLGFSAYSQIKMGLFGSIAGFCILVNMLLIIELGSRRLTFIRVLCVSFLAALLCYTHILTSIFAIGIMCFLFLFKRYRYFLTLCTPIVLILILPLSLNFYEYIPYQSSTSIGLHYTTHDPLFALLPGLRSLIAGAVWNEGIYAHVNRVFILIIGYFIFMGISLSYRKSHGNKPWVILFIIGFVVVTRNIFPNLISLPLHYYRFTPVLLLLAIGFCGYSFSRLILSHPIMRYKSKFLLTSFIIFITASNIILFDWNAPLVFPKYGSEVNEGKKFNIFRQDNLATPEVDALLSFISSSPLPGRVVVESSDAIIGRFGSPHVLLAELPKTGREVLPGLLAESSLVGSLIIRSLSIRSAQLSWGQYPLALNDEILDLTIKKVVDRFRKMGVRFLISSSELYRESLQDLIGDGIVAEHQFGVFSVFDIGTPSNVVRLHSKAPWLYLSNASSNLRRVMDFRKFSVLWWSRDMIEDIPLITDSNLSMFTDNCQNMSGVLLQVNTKYPVSDELLKRISQCGRPVIILGGNIKSDIQAENFISILDIRNPSNLSQLDKYILDNSTPILTQTSGEVRAGIDGIQIDAPSNAWVSYAYAPSFKSEVSNTYHAAPGWIYDIGAGRRFLRFE